MERLNKILNKIHEKEYFVCERENDICFPHNYVECQGPYKNLSDAQKVQSTSHWTVSRSFIINEPSILPKFMQHYLIYHHLKPIVNIESQRHSDSLCSLFMNCYYNCKIDDHVLLRTIVNCNGPFISKYDANKSRNDEKNNNHVLIIKQMFLPGFIAKFLIARKFTPLVLMTKPQKR